MIINAQVSTRIAMLRFLMIFGVVVLHTPLYVPIAEIGSDWFDLTKAYFQHAVFRATVPVLAFISGYLLFSKGADQRPGQLYRKKFQALVVPYLFFNLSLLALSYLAQTKAGISLGDPLTPFDAKVWANEAFGLTDAPINYPLNFLREMIVLAFLAPLLGILLRTAPWLGLALIAPFFFFDFDGYLILRTTTPILFYLGGMAAVLQWDMLRLDKYAKPCLVVFLGVCVAMVYFRVANNTYLRLAAPLLIWPAAALIDRTALGKWLASLSKYSFFVFVAHAPILPISWMMYQNYGSQLPYPWYWFLSPVATTLLLIAIYKLAMRHIPATFNTILGTRQPGRSKAAPLTAPM